MTDFSLPLTPEAREELRRLAEQATPGRWIAATKMHPEAVRMQKEAASVYGPDCLIYTSRRDYGLLPETWAQQCADAEFIAATSPAAILALLTDSDRLAGTLKEATEVLRVGSEFVPADSEAADELRGTIERALTVLRATLPEPAPK